MRGEQRNSAMGAINLEICIIWELIWSAGRYFAQNIVRIWGGKKNIWSTGDCVIGHDIFLAGMVAKEASI